MESRLTLPPSTTRNALQRRVLQFGSVYWRPGILAALTVWVVWSAFHVVQKVIEYYTPLPMWDYWRVVENLNDYRSFHLAALWRQHNEHRIVFPEIVFALDMLLLHGRMLLPLVLSGLSYAGTWLVLSSTLFSEATMPPFIRMVAILISGVVAFWEGAASVLAVPFLLQWTLMQLAAAVALVSASKLRAPQSQRQLAITLAACIVASYSSGNAIVLWPIVIVVAIAVGAKRQFILTLAVTAASALGVYFIRYRLIDQSKITNLISYPLYSIQYVASYLSMPFGAMKSPAFAVKLGFWLCMLVLVLFLTAAAARRLVFHPIVVLFSYFCFTFLTAVITAAGRLDAADSRFTAAHAFRYLSVPQMNWSAGILLLFTVLCGFVPIRKYLPILAGAVALVLWNAFPKLSPWLGGVSSYLTEEQLATLSVESGLHYTQLMQAEIYPDAAFLDTMLARLREQHLSIYHGGWNRYLGRPLTSVTSVQPEGRVPGVIVEVMPVQSGFQLSGWADRAGRKMPPVCLVFTDESGNIVGFGKQFPAGLPAVLASPKIPSSLAWVGFIAGQAHPTVVSAYVRAPERKAVYPLGQPVHIHTGEENASHQEPVPDGSLH